MKILITGGAGYIGSVLTPFFLDRGDEVIVIDNFMYNQTSLLDCCGNKNLTIIRGDARDQQLLKDSMSNVDAIIPLACLTGAPLCDKEPEEAESVIVEALQLILDLRSKDQKIVYPTTNSGYGVGETGKFCTEESALRPVSLYGRLKVKAEDMVLQSGNGLTFRLATAFGISPRMRLDLLVNDFTWRAVRFKSIELYESHFMRNFIHVRDIARAFGHSLDNFEQMQGQAYNVGLSDANLSKMDLCLEIKKFIPDFEITESKTGKDPDQRDYIVSNEKIEKTGFKPAVSLQDGIQELIKGFQVISQEKSSLVQLTNI